MKTVQVAAKTFGFIIVSMLGLPIVAAFLMWLADGGARVPFNEANIFSVRYIVSVLLLMALLIPFFVMADKREPGAPLTWGEAMVAAVYVFFVLFWLYGVVPHEYLNWADAELSWRPDKKVIGIDGQWASWWGFWGTFPMTISKVFFRDIIAVLIYGVGLGGFIWAFAHWNDRAKKAAEQAAEKPVSTYGRPLIAKAKG